MINPRNFIRVLEKQWLIIEQLALTLPEQFAWQEETVLSYIKKIIQTNP
jgi:hypothetical protein